MSDTPPAESAAIGPRPTGTDLDEMWRLANEARARYEDAAESARAARDAAEEQSREAKRAQDEVQKQKSALAEQRQRQDQREQSLDERSSRLDDRGREQRATAAEFEKRKRQLASERDALTRREATVKARELNAEADFSKEREAMLVKLDERAESLRATVEALELEHADKRAAWHREADGLHEILKQDLDERRAKHKAELDEHRARGDADLRNRERQLDEREQSLHAREQTLAKAQRELEWDRDEVKDLEGEFDERVQRRAARQEEKYRHQIAMLEQQLGQARTDRDSLADTLLARQEADRSFGQRTPDEVRQELQQLRASNDRLREEIARLPDEDAALRLAHLDAEKEHWQAERRELIDKLADTEARLARLDAAQLEIATREEQIANLEKTRDALQQSALELREQVDSLISHADARTAFPACQAMDNDGELQNQLPMDTRAVASLDDFVRDLQQRIAWDPAHPEDRLYYSLEDLRSFLAGLAMGSLVLLQGISGTGKTSLPIAFARAVGTRATVVEVQAGWRDPQDLVGHYNAFEKRFYEREFLQALYRARTPRWRDAVHLVVLDEMNLSHPEQYFSDMLSALERKPEDRRLVLMSHTLATAPDLFLHGRELAIPENVWFVGTANHDETTKGFADKTYDRSHIMEFPHQPVPFEVHRPHERAPLSYKALQDAFAKAVKKYCKQAEHATRFLRDHVRDPLARDFHIGWGPRLERQIERYVPVVIAAGGSIGEGVDYLLAMRLLRKLQQRYDNRPDHLRRLDKAIVESWSTLGDKKTQPDRSRKVINDELRRLGELSEDEQ